MASLDAKRSLAHRTYNFSMAIVVWQTCMDICSPHVGSGPVNEPSHGTVLFTPYQSLDGNYGIRLLSVVRILVVLCVPCSRSGVCQVLMGAGWQL